MTTDKRIIVIHHSADFDGLFCREIARRHFGDQAEYIGWDYGQPEPVVPAEAEIYLLDISVPELMDHPRLTWIDHHQSAMERYGKKPGFQIDGVAACRLAWQWFHRTLPSLFTKEDYIDRTVHEPLAVRLAGEYDIWDRRDPNAELFQHGLRAQELTPDLWKTLLEDYGNGVEFYYDPSRGATRPAREMFTLEPGFSAKNPPVFRIDLAAVSVGTLLERGKVVKYAKEQENADVITNYGFDVEWEGLRFLACNSAKPNSQLFNAGLQPHHEALLGFKWDGKLGRWRVSLYHAPGHEQHDLSQIAVRHGGGGHRGACGFEAQKLPFLP